MNETSRVHEAIGGINKDTPKLVAAIGERASATDKRIWIDPTKASGVVEKGSPEMLVIRFNVIKTVPGENGTTIVAYTSEDRSTFKRVVDADEAAEFHDSVFTRTARDGSGGSIDLDWYHNQQFGDEVILSMDTSPDGSLRVKAINGPNVHVRSVGGPDDDGLYRLNGSTLELYKRQDRTSLLERIANENSLLIDKATEETGSGILPDSHESNFGTTITGGDHGDGFLPVEGKPGRDGRPLNNEFAGEIPVAARR